MRTMIQNETGMSVSKRDWWRRPFRKFGTTVGPFPLVHPSIDLSFPFVITTLNEGFDGRVADVLDVAVVSWT